jgi:hypothetical protein
VHFPLFFTILNLGIWDLGGADRPCRFEYDRFLGRPWINTLSTLRKHISKRISTILSGVAEMQLAMIRERTSKAMRHYQAQGRRMGRLDRCPYGKMPDSDGPMVKDKETGQFTERPAQMMDHPEEQEVIERIRRLRAEGNGLRKIAKYLEQAGIPCRGKRGHASTIASILKRNVLSVS